MNEAAALLAHATAGFPPQEVWLDCRGGSYDDQHQHVLVPHDRVNAELGVLRLACGQYDQALDLLLRAGWWEDAAYIAECVLRPEELAHYVDANWPASLVGPNAPLWTENAVADSRRCEKIRGLLARRLMRLDRWKEARPYFPPANQAILDSYVAAIRDGHNADRSDDDRADSCLLAARLARIHGSELFEHDSEPSRGGYETASGRRQYFAITIVASREHPIPNTSLGATPDEINRATRYAPKRYSRVEISLIAAGHAWSAAALMPDESDETARVLCTAGNWIIANDAKTAAPFYRALIGRCSTTDLGRQAAKINGLPRVP
jgi:hypothetical protein